IFNARGLVAGGDAAIAPIGGVEKLTCLRELKRSEYVGYRQKHSGDALDSRQNLKLKPARAVKPAPGTMLHGRVLLEYNYLVRLLRLTCRLARSPNGYLTMALKTQ